MTLEHLPIFREVKNLEGIQSELYLPLETIKPLFGSDLTNERYSSLSLQGYKYPLQIYALGKIIGQAIFSSDAELLEIRDYVQPKLLYRPALGTFVSGLDCAPDSVGPLCTLPQDQVLTLELLRNPSFTLVSSKEFSRQMNEL